MPNQPYPTSTVPLQRIGHVMPRRLTATHIYIYIHNTYTYIYIDIHTVLYVDIPMCYPQPTGAGVEEMMSLVRAADVFAGKHPQQEQQEDIPQEM